MHTLETLFSVLTGVISLTGTIFNILTLSFFIKHPLNTTENENISLCLTRRLYITLSTLDLTVSIFVFICSIRHYIDPSFMTICNIICLIAAHTAGFVTVLLAVLQSIYLGKPGYHVIRSKIVYLSVLVYGVAMMFLVTVTMLSTSTTPYIISFFNLAGIFLILVSTSLMNTTKILLNPQQSTSSYHATTNSHVTLNSHVTNERHVTITVTLLSVVYCFFNISYLIHVGLTAFPPLPSTTIPAMTRVSLPALVHQVDVYVLLPLKSTCSPVVWWVRDGEMRRYLVEVFRRITGVCVRRYKPVEYLELSETDQITDRRDHVPRKSETCDQRDSDVTTKSKSGDQTDPEPVAGRSSFDTHLPSRNVTFAQEEEEKGEKEEKADNSDLDSDVMSKTISCDQSDSSIFVMK